MAQGSEMSDNLSKGQSVCSDCHKAYHTATGEFAKEWMYTYFVSHGEGLYNRCKDILIDALAKDIPR